MNCKVNSVPYKLTNYLYNWWHDVNFPDEHILIPPSMRIFYFMDVGSMLTKYNVHFLYTFANYVNQL